MNVLVILGHPRADSLCGALADAFCDGVRAAGVALRRLNLSELDFDPHVHMISPNDQALEADLEQARELIRWADHLVFVYPTWWGTTPALLKGFLDRMMSPGFAFRTCEGGIGYEGLLKGRSAQLITTMDTPPLIHRLLYREPGRNAMGRATLGFCGIRPVRAVAFGSVKDASGVQREAWLARANRLGRQLARGRITPGEKVRHKVGAWLKAVRLQFYPMTWVAYAIGGLAASPEQGVFGNAVFWLGYLCLFLLEVATVLTNELVDLESDRNNRFYSALTGGSRVLVEGLLSRREVRTGISVTLLGGLFGSVWLMAIAPAAPAAILLVLGGLAILALGYTAPPLKFCYRGLGELDVAITHSIGVLLCGYVFLGGAWHDSLPWWLSVPLLLAILPAITLSGIPDLEADAAAGKRTLAVRLGRGGALWVALVFTVLAAVCAVIWQAMELAEGAYGGIALAVVPHGSLLAWWLIRQLRTPKPPGRIDGLMAASLSYVLWFGLFPLFHLF
ncbi:NAD(P)H-dependent oxidoreductase [Halomonas korlensis]|uniref:Putative NADPH-quinone reductase (Modulator of drug activity B) n=1 Tax=Halomonas korlensis TaxID=463301 RepID=A0A1I7K858_9GAMM|nr:NAD(P)H-dependent oxidoreductase [Halomonas korlensis]SFU93601.1 Putative NADPH-quinone reductase (modulator of drug activity B) [Halomonas korlensis]